MQKILFVFLFCALVFANCTTTSTARDNIELIQRNTQYAGRIETAVRELDNTIGTSRTRIGIILESSKSIESGVEKLEYLFVQYEQEVERLLREIEQVRDEIEETSKNNNSGSGSFNSMDSSSGGFGCFKSQVQNASALLDKPFAITAKITPL